MLSRASTLRSVSRLWPTTRARLSSPLQATRWSSSQQPSPHTSFYKTFGRPIAKVLLMAVFTYQLAYWAWAKLETDEIRAERQEISALESQVKALQAGEKAQR